MAKANIKTLGDLRQFIAWLDKHSVSDELEVHDCSQPIVVLGDSEVGSQLEMIECGDHIPPDKAYDVLVNTHKHRSPPESYEEALEQGYDRYADETRPE